MSHTSERRHRDHKALNKAKRKFLRARYFADYNKPLVERYPRIKWRWNNREVDRVENDPYYWRQFHKRCRCEWCMNRKKVQLEDRYGKYLIRNWHKIY